MLSVYVDTGGWHPDIRKLEEAGALKSYYYPFENKNNKVSTIVPGSGATWDQSAHVTWETDSGTWDDDEPSPLFKALLKLVEGQLVDAQHIDSACKAGCTIFLTSDKGDIWNKRAEIGALTGIIVMHMPTEIGRLKAMC